MDTWIYIAGAAALVTNFFAYRADSVNSYRLISALAFAFLSAHFYMQDALAGAIGVGIGSIRNLVAIRYNQPGIIIVFVAATVGFCLWEWLVLDHPATLFIAYASALIFTIGSIILTSATSIRRWFIAAEALGLLYALLVGSWLGALFNVSNLTSIGVKLHADQRKTKKGRDKYEKKNARGARC